MPLTLWDVKRDPIASRALEQLGDRYTVAEEKTGLVLTGKAGDMKLFLNELDDLHQWDFIHNQKTATENEKLRSFSQNLYEQRESWKYRALVAEATLLEVADASNNGGRPNISDMRYGDIWQSSSTLITPPEMASRRLCEMKYLRRFGVR